MEPDRTRKLSGEEWSANKPLNSIEGGFEGGGDNKVAIQPVITTRESLERKTGRLE